MTTIASATPGASRVPKADVGGKLAAGWLTAAAILADLGLGAGVAGDLLYGNGANTLARLPIATAGRVLVSSGAAPAWSSKLAEGSITGLMTLSKAGSTAREITFQDAAYTVAGLGLAQTWTSSQTLERSTTSGVAWATRVTGDSVDRWRVRADGQMDWGAGGAFATDVTLYRTAVGTLTCTGALGVLGAVTTTSTIAATGSIRTTTSFFEGPISGGIAFNAYYSGGWKYRSNGYATALTDNFASGFILMAAPTGVADAAPAWQAVLTGTPTAATFAVAVTVTNGSAAAPGLRVTSEQSGLYRRNSTSLGATVAGVASVGFIAPTTGFGGSLILETPVAGDVSYIIPGSNTAAVILSGASSTTVGGQVRVYGSTHATKPSYVEFTRGATVSAFFDGSGNMALGDGTGTPTLGLLGAAGTNRTIAGYSGSFANANRRWLFYLGNSDAESGANAGSNVSLLARDDAGNGIDTVFKILRVAGGNFEIYRPIQSTGAVTVPNGTAGSPGLRVTGEASGLYRYDATSIGLAAAGVFAAAVTKPNGTTTGSVLLLSTPSAAEIAYVVLSATNSAVILSGGTGGGNGGNVRLYGSTHATKADYIEFNRGASISAFFDGSGNLTCNGTVITPAATTSLASARIPHGTAPTSPTNGDLWTTTAGAFARINGATKGMTVAGASDEIQYNSGGVFTSSALFKWESANKRLVISGDTAGNVGIVCSPTQVLTAAVTQAYAGALNLYPTYDGAWTVTRHAYLICSNPSLVNSAVLTDATLVRFDAAAGTHKAVDTGTTKTSPGAVSAWVKVDINGTVHYVPAFTSKTT